MRAAPTLCLLAALTGCSGPDPELRPAPPRRPAFGEAHPEAGLPGNDSVNLARNSVTCRDGSVVFVSERASNAQEALLANYWKTSSDVTAVDPALSNDGCSLAWAEGSDRQRFCIYRATVSNSTRILVAAGDFDCGHPCFSPEGALIAWDEALPDGHRISITDLASARVTFVTEGSSPAWSPDGEWIAFESGTPPSIWKVRVDGSSRTRLTDGRDAHRPTWSPDSRWIAFGQDDAEGRPDDIWAVRADGSRCLRVTWDPAPEWSPCWTPDGRILFTTIRNGAQGIWAVAPENTELLK